MPRIQDGFITTISQAVKEGLNLDMLTNGMQAIEAARKNPMNGTESHLTKSMKAFESELFGMSEKEKKAATDEFLLVMNEILTLIALRRK